MPRVLPVFMMGFVLVAGLAFAPVMPVAAQTLFLKPGGNQNDERPRDEKTRSRFSLPSFIVRPGNVDDARQRNAVAAQQREQQRNYERAAQQIQQQQNRANQAAFAIFEQSRNIDMSLLRPSGREPRTQEELLQISAYYTMPQVASMLEERRVAKEARLKAAMEEEMLAGQPPVDGGRAAYLRGVAQERRDQAEQQRATEGEQGGTGRPRRLFNLFR